ncbi:hypothetical protein COV53_02285 [Candidatus Gottesmanbacteria bacterium CG11_big_fil_rev_8_21_14_0_20_37_11]|uniref:Cohesin domain-containing protein n=2 Tax=Candidatus Gottesmaniibacteriota TaxID=1752720 RepID=A0A2M7RRJ1_9BACT|nr:MAG: hypothetical protein COV53_02285 [Candidatus Gottesmanbacteria bacterium CG11_big_fil_rev_8_21_14_0_20_37_11]PIZ02931.1 MAG: hypothetical protein COY59_02280 [Candidatus Gottesmanbacteria bacterium CG_4_10_14_0_8_um_filter_37_24]
MKKLLIGIGIVILIIIVIVVIRTISSSEKKEIIKEVPTPPIAFPTISSDISVDLKPKQGNRAVVLAIDGIPSNIVSIEYEMTYTTGEGLLKGSNGGPIKLKGEKKLVRDLDLGTCSTGGKCVYDTGVTSIDLVLKFNSAEGSSIFQKKYDL